MSDDLLEPGSRFGEVAVRLPEDAERVGEIHYQLVVACFACPSERCAEVVVPSLDAGEPDRGVVAAIALIRLLRQVEAPRGMPALDLVGLTAPSQRFERVLANDAQEPEPCAVVRGDVSADQALLGECRELVEPRTADGLGVFEREPGRKDRRARESLPLRVAKEVVAPVDRRAERLVALVGVAPSAREQIERVVQPFDHLRGREHSDAGGSKLDRQRQPVEERADRGDGGGILVRQLEGVTGGAGSLHEQCDRVILRECGDGEEVLAADAKRLPAGDEEGDGGSTGEQSGDVGRRIDDLLEVVENEQPPLLPEMLPEQLDDGQPRLLAQAQRLGHRQQHERGVMDRSQRNEVGAALEQLDQIGRCLQCKPRLPGPARAGQRQ